MHTKHKKRGFLIANTNPALYNHVLLAIQFTKYGLSSREADFQVHKRSFILI